MKHHMSYARYELEPKISFLLFIFIPFLLSLVTLFLLFIVNSSRLSNFEPDVTGIIKGSLKVIPVITASLVRLYLGKSGKVHWCVHGFGTLCAVKPHKFRIGCMLLVHMTQVF
jgi:hypothetical protein